MFSLSLSRSFSFTRIELAVFVALKDVLNASLNPPNVLMYPYNPALSFKKMLKDIGSKNIYNIILHLELSKVPQLLREVTILSLSLSLL